MRHQSLAVHVELVAFRFASEDMMIVQHEAVFLRTRSARKEQRSRESADAAADYCAIEGFARIYNLLGGRVECVIANSVPGGHHRVRVAVGRSVIADP